MTKKNNTTIYQKLIKSKIFFIFLIAVFLTLVTGIFQKIYYQYEARRELNKLNAELANLSNEKSGLNKLIDYYKNKSNVEKEARVRLNLKKEGEKVVIILPSATSTGGTGKSIFGPYGVNLENLPNYKRWWYYFFVR